MNPPKILSCKYLSNLQFFHHNAPHFRIVSLAFAVIILVAVWAYLIFASEACMLSIWCGKGGAKEAVDA